VKFLGLIMNESGPIYVSTAARLCGFENVALPSLSGSFTYTRFVRSCWASVAAIAVLSSFGANAEIIAKAKRAPTDKPAAAHPEMTQAIIRLNLPLEQIAKIINQFDFKTHSKGVANVYIVGDVHYDGTAVAGHVALTPSNQEQFPVELKVPFRWIGTIGPFDVKADGDLTIDFGLRVKGPDWCPLVEFSEPIVELYPDKAINLANVPYAKIVIRDVIANEMKKQVNCATFQKMLASLWHVQMPAVQVGDKTFVFNVKPETIAVTDATVANGRLVLRAAVGLTTILSSQPMKVEKISLPPPEANPQISTKSDGDIEASFSLKLGLGFQ
jgi:hypothetical protein